MSVRTGELTGYEALARWSRPGTGPVRPDVFIAVAESSTLVCDLGRWALLEATTQLAGWRAAGKAGFGREGAEPTVAVNLSGRHLADPRVMDDVRAALAVSGLPAGLLVLEITETVLMNDPRATTHLKELRAQGIRVAIDDFGTGYTSIGALPSTPADILKIDRSFISSTDPGHHQLATLIIRAAHTFALRVVAEGIETPEQLARLQADGCGGGAGLPVLPGAAAEEAAQFVLPPAAVAAFASGPRPLEAPAASVPGPARPVDPVDPVDPGAPADPADPQRFTHEWSPA